MFDRKTLLGVGVALLVILIGLLIATNCVGPLVLNASSGDMRYVCSFSWPWWYLFGFGQHIYNFNFYLCVGSPAILLVLYFVRTMTKRDR